MSCNHILMQAIFLKKSNRYKIKCATYFGMKESHNSLMGIDHNLVLQLSVYNSIVRCCHIDEIVGDVYLVDYTGKLD